MLRLRSNNEGQLLEKVCTKCNQVLSVSEFYIYPKTRHRNKTGRINFTNRYEGVPDTHTPEAQCKLCKERAGRWGAYRQGARRRGYTFNLTKEEFFHLLEQDCYYCGASAKDVRVGYNGIDRIDNAIGYESDNVVTACGTCNQWKLDMSQSDFLQHARRIIDRTNYQMPEWKPTKRFDEYFTLEN